MYRRGNERCAVWYGEGATLAVARHAWEFEEDFSGGILLLVGPELVVAADAAIFYRNDLLRRLRAAGVEPGGPTGSHLIAAAYRAWGEECPTRLEGEFAFLIWDRRKRRAFCSRDFLAKRPLHYSWRDRTLIVASTIGGVVAHPEVPDDLDLESIAATAAGMNAAGPETCYAAVRTLPAASDLGWEAGRLMGPRRHWEPEVESSDPMSFEDAAARLRELLCDSVGERLARNGSTAVWMSGGWDSSSVFGAGQAVLRSKSDGRNLRPVSISYPIGDPGREDEWIEAIAAHWNVPVHWLDIRNIRFFDDPWQAAPPDEPFRHLYAQWNRALAEGSRAAGSRIALDGNGGDQIFQLSPIYLADLLRAGRWLELGREWRALGGKGFRPFFRTAIQPNLPASLLALTTWIRGGRRLRSYVERWTPSWFDKAFLERTRLADRDLQYLPDRTMGSRGAAELAWYWTSPFGHRIAAHLSGIALEGGVELRSPLADRRVVEFALRRPREERSYRGETKRLLRAAMRGLLPEEVLAPRRWRTGTTDGFSHSQMSSRFLALVDAMLREPMRLEALGVVRAEAYRQAAAGYRSRRQSALRVALLYTYYTEQWLRMRASKSPAPTGGSGETTSLNRCTIPATMQVPSASALCIS